ncbi:MAG TPA: hypothetical protein VGJ49_00945 [Gaiellaceae bacterium]|jgi:hypothetical protein
MNVGGAIADRRRSSAGLAMSFANGIRLVVSNQISQRLHVWNDGIEASPGFHEFRVTCEDFDAAREGHHLVDSHHDHKRAAVENHPRFFAHACSAAFSRRLCRMSSSSAVRAQIAAPVPASQPRL